MNQERRKFKIVPSYGPASCDICEAVEPCAYLHSGVYPTVTRLCAECLKAALVVCVPREHLPSKEILNG
jgi:hypothetical protein